MTGTPKHEETPPHVVVGGTSYQCRSARSQHTACTGWTLLYHIDRHKQRQPIRCSCPCHVPPAEEQAA